MSFLFSVSSSRLTLFFVIGSSLFLYVNESGIYPGHRSLCELISTVRGTEVIDVPLEIVRNFRFLLINVSTADKIFFHLQPP